MHEQVKEQQKTLLLISNKVYHYRMPIYEHLSQRLAKIGYNLLVLADEVEPHIGRAEHFNIIVEPFKFSSYKRHIEQTKPAIVMFFLHARDWIAWPLLLALKLRRIPVIYWNHGINLMTPNNVIKRVVFGLFHRYADALVLYSSNEKKFIARRYWQKLFVANNTINFSSIPNVPDSKVEIRKQWDIPYEKIVLFVGRITENKRLDDLLEAAPLLNDGIGVVIVGGSLSESQQQIIDRSDNIRYLGPIYDPVSVNQVFKMSDVFSIPGKVGLGVNQAFYWGLPIVTEKVLHSPEIVYVKDGINGFMVDKHDTQMLAEKINLLLSSEELCRQFSEAARTEINTNANIDKMCDGFIDAVRFLENRNSASNA